MNDKKKDKKPLEVIEEDQKPNYKKMDPVQKQRVMLEWKMRKDFEQNLRDQLVENATQSLIEEKVEKEK